MAVATGLVASLFVDRPSLALEAPRASSLTWVAATEVVGTRVSSLGWTAAALVALALGTATLLGLLGPVLWHRQERLGGEDFLPCVATQGLAVLGATLVSEGGPSLLAVAAAGLLAAGIALYASTLVRFDWGEIVTGGGDQWVLAGALAISSLATARLLAASSTVHLPSGVHPVLQVLDLGLWTLAAAMGVALAVGEGARPRRGSDRRRWATVFPLGMIAAAAMAVAQANRLGSLRYPGVVMTWVAVSSFVVVAAAAIVRGARSRALAS